VVNRHKEKSIETRLIHQSGQLGNKAAVYEVYHENLQAANSFEGHPVKRWRKPRRARMRRCSIHFRLIH
jgi:hypothetical protein